MWSRNWWSFGGGASLSTHTTSGVGLCTSFPVPRVRVQNLCANEQTHTHVHAHTHARARTHTHTHTEAHRAPGTQTGRHTHTHTHTHGQTHTHTHTHTHTYIHTHSRGRNEFQWESEKTAFHRLSESEVTFLLEEGGRVSDLVRQEQDCFRL